MKALWQWTKCYLLHRHDLGGAFKLDQVIDLEHDSSECRVTIPCRHCAYQLVVMSPNWQDDVFEASEPRRVEIRKRSEDTVPFVHRGPDKPC